MFNIGGGELIVIMLLALIVLGPKRLPEAARQIGKVMADLRRLSTGFQNEVRTALDSVDDTDHVTARRNVLARDEPAIEAVAPSDPVPADPLVAAPGLEPGANETSAVPAKAPPPSAQARAAARKQAAAKRPASGAEERASATNGTPLEKADQASPEPAPRRRT